MIPKTFISYSTHALSRRKYWHGSDETKISSVLVGSERDDWKSRMKVTCAEQIMGLKQAWCDDRLQITIHRRAVYPTEATGIRTVACEAPTAKKEPYPTDAEHKDEDLNSMGAW